MYFISCACRDLFTILAKQKRWFWVITFCLYFYDYYVLFFFIFLYTFSVFNGMENLLEPIFVYIKKKYKYSFSRAEQHIHFKEATS